MAESCCEAMFWVYLMISFGLVMFAGIMSGLTLGLMSLSLVDLEVLVKAGKPQDQRNAAKILPVVKNQHLLLCTLLIGNSLAMEALPIFLDALVPAWGAVLISVTLILAFGEIIPQAVCTRYGLSVGAKMAPVVRILLIVFFPVAYPISKLLDWILGKGHFALMRRAELKTLVDMHGNEAGKGGELTHDETTIITGALDLTQKTAEDSMTPINKIFALDINAKLDMHTLGLIMSKGHSRVPIYSGNPANIIGLILVKNLITCRPEDEVPIRDVTIRKIPRVYDDLPLYVILNEFQKGHSHMAVVVKRNKSAENNIVRLNGEKPRKILAEHLASSSPANTTQSPIKRTNGEAPRQQIKRLDKSERSRKNNILDVNNWESLPSYSDEEVVGIITMEDVMEELLQEEILDETDEYVDVHNKIKINMLPPKKSSPGITSVSNLSRKTPISSPLNNNNNNNNLSAPRNMSSPQSNSHNNVANNISNIINSSSDNNNNNNNNVLSIPISQSCAQTPNISPNINFSAIRSLPASPSKGQISPSHKVPRKSYEKLKKSGEES